MKVMFSRLCYFPSFLSTDCIEIAILFQQAEKDIRRFEITSNWQRLKSFDDELDIDYFKLILNGIKAEVSNESLFNYKRDFDICKYIKSFANELKFTNITTVETDDFDALVEETRKMYLRYDYDKKERPSLEHQAAFMKRILRDNKIKFCSSKIIGNYRENIKYDCIVENYAFKFFSFENKKVTKVVASAKTWAYNAKEMEATYKTIFVYDTDVEDELFEYVLLILKENAYGVMRIHEAMDFILKKELKSTDYCLF